MDHSSPLAAMQPGSQPFGHWGIRRETQPIFRPILGKDLSCSSGNFNFGDLSFAAKPTDMPMDYFSLKPVRGSSPTSSLAVDLSQNCHIDQSPLPATPRRSLFTTKSNGTLNARLTTPDEDSSPFRADDVMDISPLPHKTPFFRAASVPAVTPMPVDISAGSSLLSSPNCIPESPLANSKPSVPFERRRPTVLRPSLSRARTQTSSHLSIKSAGLENNFPSFRFGSGSSGSTTTLDTLAECFADSPPPNPFSARNTNYISTQKPRVPFPCTNVGRQNNASPSSISRRVTGPIQRPRKQYRRSLSMYEHPGDVMKANPEPLPEPNLNSVTAPGEKYKVVLPHKVEEDETIPRISKEVMIDVLDGKYNAQFDHQIIVDCRFEFEYNGGHIDGAINLVDKVELVKRVFEKPGGPRTLVILHCEYSAHRAPISASHLRNHDRAVNDHQYPKLTFPEMYILDGGYNSFFLDYRLRCFPPNYIEMNDENHKVECEKGLGKMKQKPRTKLGRAQTFAFGQHPQEPSDDPPPPKFGARAAKNTDMDMDMDLDLAVDSDSFSNLKHFTAQRKASA